jgi:hypothetical protein
MIAAVREYRGFRALYLVKERNERSEKEEGDVKEMTDLGGLSDDEILVRIPRAGRDFWKAAGGLAPGYEDTTGVVYEGSDYANLVAEARRRGLDRPAV